MGAMFHIDRRKQPPAGFAETFVRWGWRGVETAFGARTECNKRWVAQCGEAQLIASRRAYRANLRQLKA